MLSFLFFLFLSLSLPFHAADLQIKPFDSENVNSLFKGLLIKKTEMFTEIKLQEQKSIYGC